jgi:hypothetical protein
MDDDAQQPEWQRSPAKRALRGAARPFLGFFDKRFEGLHEHLDQHRPDVAHLEAVMHGRFEHVLRELRDTRTDVAADTDTIAELAFTLERFADLFTVRMEEIAGQIAATTQSPSQVDSTVVELPFAFAAAAALERGATAATIADDGRLSIGLAALGLQVTALEPTRDISHPDVAVVDERAADWGGPSEPFHAVFVLTAASYPASDSRAVREKLDLVHKWLRPSGSLVLGARVDGDPDLAGDDEDALPDWDVERRARFGQDRTGAWRRFDDVAGTSIVLIRATPRS